MPLYAVKVIDGCAGMVTNSNVMALQMGDADHIRADIERLQTEILSLVLGETKHPDCILKLYHRSTIVCRKETIKVASWEIGIYSDTI